MRLRGFSVMTNIFDDYGQDVEVQTLASLLFYKSVGGYADHTAGHGVHDDLAVDSNQELHVQGLASAAETELEEGELIDSWTCDVEMDEVDEGEVEMEL